MSFGNMGSTQRLFRRVASNNSSDSSRPDGTSRSGGSNEENLDPAPRKSSRDAPSTSKEALLGHRVFTKALEPALAELHAQTSGQQRREALARLSDALALLDSADPEGTYHLVQGLVSAVSHDKKLSQAFLPQGTPADEPKTSSATAPAPAPVPAPEGYTHGTVINMNKRADQQQASAPASPAKALFSGTPASPAHLRSHRRRRGSQVPSEAGPTGRADSRLDERQPRGDPERAALEARFPGREAQPGMEHCRQLSELLYGRWVSNVHTRWPGIATGQ